MFAKFVSGKLSAKFQKTLMVALVLVMLFSSLPLSKAQAAGGFFDRSSVFCNPLTRTAEIQDHFWGAYDGQWARFRYHISISYDGKYWQGGFTGWQNIQLKTFGSARGLSLHSMRIPTNGLYIQVRTDVQYYENGYWGPAYSLHANHIDFIRGAGYSFCQG